MRNLYKKECSCCEKYFDNLFYLKSIIRITKEFCQEREFSASYYGLSSDLKVQLSEERNLYINMLDMALEKMLRLEQINTQLENIIYNKIPTIAADK